MSVGYDCVYMCDRQGVKSVGENSKRERDNEKKKISKSFLLQRLCAEMIKKNLTTALN